jgi:glycosyltransferase involved in cell wall biosynthesis
MRVAILAPSRHALCEPFAGGQERLTADIAAGLRRRGHQVQLYARAGTDPSLADDLHTMPDTPPLSEIASGDLNMPEPRFLSDQVAFLGVMRNLLRDNNVDAVLNQSLHQLPLALSPALAAPMVTTLHTPPFPWMEVGAWLAGTSGHFVAVSDALRAQWTTLVRARVIHNGVDPQAFPSGAGGPDLAWVGRLTGEKGADIAVRAAERAGRHLRIAGPVSDPAWFGTVLRPLLGGGAEYVGTLSGQELVQLYGSSAATLVTPLWEEPFCLVAAESQMCGTPVAGLRRGGLPEVVGTSGGRLVAGEDALAGAVDVVTRMDRRTVAADARCRLSTGRMLDKYEQMLVELVTASADSGSTH